MVTLSKPLGLSSGMYWVTGSCSECMKPSSMAMPMSTDRYDLAIENEATMDSWLYWLAYAWYCIESSLMMRKATVCVLASALSQLPKLFLVNMMSAAGGCVCVAVGYWNGWGAGLSERAGNIL